MEQERWQWQEPGKAWKGAGLYHITLTVTSRRAVLGALIVPDNDAERGCQKGISRKMAYGEW
jgi:hypothetical protein